MKALALNAIKSPLQLEDRPDLIPGPDEVVVSVKAAALNRRDYWITQGMYPGIKPPVILGSDGAGIVSRTGSGIPDDWVGRDVIIDPGTDWGDNDAVQSAAFTILGLPRDGTFATEVVVPACQIHSKPAHLDWTQAAALPLAGVTAYRALFTQGGLNAAGSNSNQRVLITGIGGGVATFALQFAVASGADVWVTSSSPEKIDRAMEFGARGGFNYNDDDWGKQLIDQAGAPNLIVDSAGGKGYGSLIHVAAPGGRIVNYGATTGPPEKLDLFKVFWKQLRLQGTTMGSPNDFAKMLGFVDEHKISPIIDSVCPLEEGAEAIGRMKSSPQFGKCVLSIQS
ncbi:MAG: zinc-binding dehydrogenase [Planctomycetales bacterium]|nr:zinc-binding dehydrogenase [Planctomycetales bacterium]